MTYRQRMLSLMAPPSSQVLRQQLANPEQVPSPSWREWNARHGLRWRLEHGLAGGSYSDRIALANLTEEEADALRFGPPAPPPPGFFFEAA